MPDKSTPVKLFIDARFTRTDYHDGISRYGANLIEAVAKIHPVTMIINDDRQLKLLPTRVPYVKLNSPISAEELLIPHKLNKLGAEVVFSPMQVMGSWGRKYKLILTLHDLIYYENPEPPRDLPEIVRKAWRLYHKAYWPQRMMLDRADAIATVSKTTRALISQYHLTKRPVHIVSNAGPAADISDLDSGPFAEEGAAGSAGRGKSLVYMGSFMPYKNVETLVRGMELLPEHTLHLLSKITPQQEARLRSLTTRHTSERIIFHRGVSEEKYYDVLRQATAAVTASTSEGFGLPIVEALSAGTPVVCSDLNIFREIAADSARYFSSWNVYGFVEAVLSLENPQVRAQSISRGKIEASRYSWDSSAQELLAVAYDLIES